MCSLLLPFVYKFISCFIGSSFCFLGADSRSRGARAPWFVRSVDILSFAVSSSAQSYLFGFRSLFTLSAFAVGVLRSFDMFIYAVFSSAQLSLCGLILGGVKRESQRS